MARILLVEDNELNRDMLSRRLTRKGHVVQTAPDGESGVAAAVAGRPDLVIMDLGLPGIDGCEATRRLKESEATARIPVLVLTAHAMPADRERATRAGCDDFDTKPVDIDRLAGKITDLLARAAAGQPGKPEGGGA